MLSFGIRFGQGFDRISVIKVMQSVPSVFDYDLLVLGCNPGGIACAVEASAAGKKAAIIKWKIYTPAEEEGFDEDLKIMADALEVQNIPSVTSVKSNLVTDSDPNVTNTPKNKKKAINSNVKSWMSFSSRSTALKGSIKNPKKSRGVRQSRLDLNNELFKRGQQGRKLMHNAANCQYVLEDARNCGWRFNALSKPPSINWNKMSEKVMDFVMRENWKLVTELNDKGIEVIEGTVKFINSHTVKVLGVETGEQEITSENICIAASSEYIFPDDVKGALEFGINCDDFTRLDGPPGKTLIVGDLPEGFECAGIAVSCQNPVTMISASKVPLVKDTEMLQLIKTDLINRGVVFLENKTLKSIKLNSNDKLLATFESKKDVTTENLSEAEFDTVVFAIGKITPLKFLSLENAGIDLDSVTGRIRTNEHEETLVRNIYAVGDSICNHPDNFEMAELAGRLLAKRLFKNETEITDYSMAPFVIYTPIEYAYLGISEDAALLRLGEECVDVYHGYFKPIDFVLPPKQHQCYAKLIVLRSKDLIIGLHFFGPEAGEIIQGFAVAFKMGLTMKQLHSGIGVHATKAQEILKLKEVKTYKAEKELYIT